jgi:hypothetical protein
MNSSSEERYAALVDAFVRTRGATLSGKGFGSNALKIDNKIFAMLSSKGSFVVKLPPRRVDELVTAGDGERYDAGKGRPMKEWLSVAPGSSIDWSDLATEALAFVSSKR